MRDNSVYRLCKRKGYGSAPGARGAPGVVGGDTGRRSAGAPTPWKRCTSGPRRRLICRSMTCGLSAAYQEKAGRQVGRGGHVDAGCSPGRYEATSPLGVPVRKRWSTKPRAVLDPSTAWRTPGHWALQHGIADLLDRVVRSSASAECAPGCPVLQRAARAGWQQTRPSAAPR